MGLSFRLIFKVVINLSFILFPAAEKVCKKAPVGARIPSRSNIPRWCAKSKIRRSQSLRVPISLTTSPPALWFLYLAQKTRFTLELIVINLSFILFPAAEKVCKKAAVSATSGLLLAQQVLSFLQMSALKFLTIAYFDRLSTS